MRLVAATLIFLTAFGQVLAAPPERIPVKAFFSNPAISRAALSADGKTFAFIFSNGDKQTVFSLGVAPGSKPVGLVKIDDPETRLAWLAWANADRLLISAESRNPFSVGVRSRMRQLFGVNRDGKNFGWLGKKWQRYGQLQIPVIYQDQIVHWTPADPDSVLIEYRNPFESSPDVMRMNVSNGRVAVAQPRLNDIQDWHADADGNVRAGEATTETNLYRLYARVAPKDKLELVIEHPIFGDGGPTFAGFHADATKLYVQTLQDGRSAIFEFDIPTKKIGPEVFAHQQVDVDNLQRDAGMDERVIGARYTVDRPEIHFFDPLAREQNSKLAAEFKRQLGSDMFHEVVSQSADGNQQILEVSSDIQPPVYYFHDRAKWGLTRILESRPGLGPKNLAPMKRITYPARDGLTISGYLTLPRGVEPKNLPVVVNVHGGPWSRDLIQWDPEVQVLASREIAVLQLNFRGSTGFGKELLKAGYREWGQKIQDDITDGVKWLIASGIAGPDRIGIMGGSYGGYATLVGLTKTPELYRAGAAYASVTDIGFLISDDKWYDWGYEWHETMVGGERGDQDRLRQASPLRNVANVRAPVLLGHGEDDQRVHVRQSRRMTDALRKAGKDVEYLEFPNEIHGFLLEANRVQWYEALVAFFEKNLRHRNEASGLEEQPSRVIALADRQALPSQNVVGRGRVEVKIGLRERQQEILGYEGHFAFAENKHDVATEETIHFSRINGFKSRYRLRDLCLEAGEVSGWRRPVR